MEAPSQAKETTPTSSDKPSAGEGPETGKMEKDIPAKEKDVDNLDAQNKGENAQNADEGKKP